MAQNYLTIKLNNEIHKAQFTRPHCTVPIELLLVCPECETVWARVTPENPKWTDSVIRNCEAHNDGSILLYYSNEVLTNISRSLMIHEILIGTNNLKELNNARPGF